MNSSFRPQAWLAHEVRADTSWVVYITPDEVNGFVSALDHAKTLNKPLLDMTQADFPLPAASQALLRRAIDMTQGRWGMCLIKGFPVDRWTEAETRLAYWGGQVTMRAIAALQLGSPERI